jgi:hypothetical protein
MDQREDVSRISIDTLSDWQRIKTKFSEAALAQLEARIALSGLAKEHDAILFHLNKVIPHLLHMLSFQLLTYIPVH